MSARLPCPPAPGPLAQCKGSGDPRGREAVLTAGEAMREDRAAAWRGLRAFDSPGQAVSVRAEKVEVLAWHGHSLNATGAAEGMSPGAAASAARACTPRPAASMAPAM